MRHEKMLIVVPKCRFTLFAVRNILYVKSMRKKIYYIYNPNTLSYDRVYPSLRERFFTVMRHLFMGILIGVGIFAGLNYFIDSPQEKKMKKDQEGLLLQYSLMSKQLDEALTVLSDIQQRDDNLYRVLLQGEPIPAATRSAGLGGDNRYNHLSSLPDADLVISTAKKIDQLRRQLYIQAQSFDEIVELGRTHKDRLKCIPAIQPVANKDLKRTASGYGWRIDPIYKTRRFHEGMDFTAPVGTPVYVTGDGVVEFSGWQTGYGNTVVIDHGYGYKTRYAHLSKILTQRGRRVKRGEEIALVGNTGKSTGPHLHYEVIYKGQHVNPVNYYYMDLSPEEYDNMIQLAENQGQVMD